MIGQIDFSFKVECPSDFDCRPQQQCPEPQPSRPERIDKDCWACIATEADQTLLALETVRPDSQALDPSP